MTQFAKQKGEMVLSQADIEYNKLILEINKNGSWDTDGEVRPVYADGTNAYTKSIFGVQVKFQQGDIPLLTSKKVFAETAKKEMMLFWIHQTVQEKDFKDQNVKVWQQWFNKEGNLGRSYAYQFESHRHHIKEAVKVNKIHKERHGELDHSIERTVRGVGYLGDVDSVKNFTKEEKTKLYQIWEKIIDRCYNENSSKFQGYGSEGVFVDERWHCFENFLRDMRYTPQFFLAKEVGFKDWNLDKDYYQANFYGPESCVWLSRFENQAYKSNSYPIEITFPDGSQKVYVNVSEASRLTGLERKYLTKCAKGEKESFKGHKVRVVEGIYRYELSRNQVVELLKTIKKNPYSRRLMTSFWNYADVDKKELQECAWATEWNSRNEELDLILIQRSADIGLGVPFNWIQYYFLLCMVAHVSGLKVGTFTHQLGNVHYYDRHEETLLEQIQGKAYSQPTIKINEKVKDFFDFTPQDILVFGYEHGPVRSMEVAE